MLFLLYFLFSFFFFFSIYFSVHHPMILNWNSYYCGGCQMVTKSISLSTFIWNPTLRKPFLISCPHSLIHLFISEWIYGFLLYSLGYNVILFSFLSCPRCWSLEPLKLAFWYPLFFEHFLMFLIPQNVLGSSCSFSCPSLELPISSSPGSFFRVRNLGVLGYFIF